MPASLKVAVIDHQPVIGQQSVSVRSSVVGQVVIGQVVIGQVIGSQSPRACRSRPLPEAPRPFALAAHQAAMAVRSEGLALGGGGRRRGGQLASLPYRRVRSKFCSRVKKKSAVRSECLALEWTTIQGKYNGAYRATMYLTSHQ